MFVSSKFVASNKELSPTFTYLSLHTSPVCAKKFLCYFPSACPGSSAGSQCTAWRWDGKHGHFRGCQQHWRGGCPKPCPQSYSGKPLLPSHTGCASPGKYFVVWLSHYSFRFNYMQAHHFLLQRLQMVGIKRDTKYLHNELLFHSSHFHIGCKILWKSGSAT